MNAGRPVLCRSLGAVLVVMAFMPGIAAALENSVPEEPTITVRITPAKPYLQEEIVQDIRVIARYPFEELTLDLPTVAGAEIITLKRPQNRHFETYGSEGYLYETSRAIFPKQSGELEIPAVHVSGSVGVSRDEKRPFALSSDATTLTVRPPPASFGDAWWLVAREAKVDEGWSRSLTDLHVGDRFTRAVTLTVAGATGAHLPELEQDSPNGLTVLPGRSERSTEITPGGVIGKIQRSFDFRVDADQPMTIPPVRVSWWNTSTEIARTAATSDVRIEPSPRNVDALVSELMAEAAAAQDESRHGLIAIAAGGTALVIVLAFWLIRAARKVKPADRALRRELARDGSAVHAVRALSAWADAAFPDSAPMTLEDLGQRLGATARHRIEELQRAAFGQHPPSQDPPALALDIVSIAQRSRRQPAADRGKRALDRLLGPKKRLPEIEGRPLQDTG
ncbi:MAG: hypothetical protein R3F54_03985 [Alphaproteobacteria bacterium]